MPSAKSVFGLVLISVIRGTPCLFTLFAHVVRSGRGAMRAPFVCSGRRQKGLKLHPALCFFSSLSCKMLLFENGPDETRARDLCHTKAAGPARSEPLISLPPSPLRGALKVVLKLAQLPASKAPRLLCAFEGVLDRLKGLGIVGLRLACNKLYL